MKRERKRVYGWWCLKYDVMRIMKKSWLLFYNEQNTYVYTTDGREQDDLKKIDIEYQRKRWKKIFMQGR